jgi:hypothetical protein
LPTRYADRLGEGGLRYLLEEVIHYNNAHHGHANTETIVCHVTLATGAHPAAHGMIGNIWFDRTTGLTTYNIEDSDYRLLTEGADIDAETLSIVMSAGLSPPSGLVLIRTQSLVSVKVPRITSLELPLCPMSRKRPAIWCTWVWVFAIPTPLLGRNTSASPNSSWRPTSSIRARSKRMKHTPITSKHPGAGDRFGVEGDSSGITGRLTLMLN